MAKERFRRTDYSIDTNVTFLSKFGFDQAVTHKAQYDSNRYRLARDYNNNSDPNAVFVFISQLCVGYLPSQTASIVAPLMDAGDMFSVVHRHSSKGNYYDRKYDNEYSDGYYRDLNISLYNESEIARAKGEEFSIELLAELSKLHNDPVFGSTAPKHVPISSMSKNSGCVVFILAGLLIAFTALSITLF